MPCILLVDDDRELLKVTAHLLTVYGHQVFCAGNGMDAIKVMEREAVELVITDILMPDMDGCELIMALRSRPTPPRIIAISGGSGRLDSDYLLELARVMKADKVLHKPFDLANISAAISEVLQMQPVGPSAC